MKAYSEITKSFLEELVKLNKAMISVNSTIQLNKISNIEKIMNLLKENVLTQWIEIISFYDTYAYYLKEFEGDYNKINKAWSEFTQQTTPQMLGIKLQKFKEANQKLIMRILKKETDVSGCLDRVITVYDNTGNVLKTYEGKTDIEDGEYSGKVLFDLNGKRIIIYNAIVITEEK